jgi:predicted restriction endonuclease
MLYTGHGGRDQDTGRQVKDQEITAPGNAGLVRSQLEGLPVRVIRGSAGDRRFSPNSGFRYDGLFRVESHGSKIGTDGFRIWQFRMVQIEDNDASPDSTAPTTAPAGGTPGRRTTQTQRVVRNTAIAQRVKELHHHCCQVCGLAIAVDGGRYSEGAHIQGLGRPYNGPDVIENVLCLCPNDHVRFDNGALYLTDHFEVIDALNGCVIGPLRLHPSHSINVRYVQNHRARWGR